MNIAVLCRKLYAFLSSSLFFKITIGFFVVSSLYIALFSLYPMAFDENFHVGLIRAYSELWSPFSIMQKPEYDVYGAVVTDPSYLYHYLMSFPYRVLQGLFHSESFTIVVLRLINIGMCVGALVIFRKLLQEAKVSARVSNVTLLFIVLIPVMPMLAGQINYDNLMMLICAYALLLTYRIRTQLTATGHMPAAPIYILVILLAYTSVVKYAFLPIAVAIVLYLAGVYIQHTSGHIRTWKQFWADTIRFSTAQKVLFSIVFVIGVGLFAQCYVTNIVQYKNPVPDCAAVVSIERCMAYGPWGRDYMFEHMVDKPKTDGPVLYTLQDWSWGMWQRLFFTLGGPTNNYDTKKPLPVISYSAIVLFSVVVLAMLWQGRAVVRRYPVFMLAVVITALYIAALWQQQYGSYVQTGQPVAINGRYLLPLLPLLGAFGLLSVTYAARRLGVQKYLVGFVVVGFVVCLQGGGPLTYIVRSEPAWFWQNSVSQNITNTTRNVVRPFIIGG